MKKLTDKNYCTIKKALCEYLDNSNNREVLPIIRLIADGQESEDIKTPCGNCGYCTEVLAEKAHNVKIGKKYTKSSKFSRHTAGSSGRQIDSWFQSEVR